jgi:hypothetical protein
MPTPPQPARPAPPQPAASPKTQPEPNGARAAPEPDPPVKTIADEQRERSEEIQAEGVERYKAKRDERDPRDRPRTVPGVSPTQVEP